MSTKNSEQLPDLIFEEDRNREDFPPEVTLEEWAERRGVELTALSPEVISEVQSCLDGYNESRGDGEFCVIMEYLTFTWDELKYPQELERGNLSDDECDELEREWKEKRREYNRSADGELDDYFIEIQSWSSELHFLTEVKRGNVGVASSNAVLGVKKSDDYFYYQDGDRDPWNPLRWEVYCTVLSPVTENIEEPKPARSLADWELIQQLLRSHDKLGELRSMKGNNDPYAFEAERVRYDELNMEIYCRMEYGSKR